MNDVVLDADKPRSKIALKISLIYAVFSLCWILFADAIIHSISQSTELLAQIQVLKGCFFVIASSIIIYFLLLREMANAQQSQKNFLGIINSTTEAIFIHDSESGKMIDANQAASSLFGFSNDALRQRSISDLNLEPKAKPFSLTQKIPSTPYIKQTRNKNHDII